MRLGILSFSEGPVTAVAVFIYFLILFLVFWTDALPDVPKDQKGLSLQDAYDDLHHIAYRPHPYNSHANDHVRDYLLDKVRSIARKYSDVKVFDDLRSNGSWASKDYGVYFEGTNILVKIEGTEPKYWDREGVLFSAHYDSVSTAPGATDDGMGVATLLQLIEYFAKHRGKRTAIFNINNGEEDWLNGAHAFLQHPWSRIPDSFLNLEGAASGGRPLLFRATSAAVLRAFRSKHVPRPHANVLSADIFQRGGIGSGTDYSVYVEGAQLQGLDLAFYKGRSKYHTKLDAVPYTDGKEKSLWSMMEAARGAGSALLNDSKTHDRDRYVPAVYFDLFAARLVLFRLETLYIFNILFLILGPIILVGLFFIDAVIKAARKRREGPQYLDHRHPPLLTRIFTDFRLIWRWAKFWVAIIVTIGVQALLILIFVKANPYIIYSNPYIILFCLTVMSFITFTRTITFDLPASDSDDEAETSTEHQKETVLLQSYTLSWILLLLATITIGKAQVGGVYLLTYWSVGLWVACGLASLETVFEFHDTSKGKSHSRLRSRSRSSSRSSSSSSSSSGSGSHPRRRREPTERTPLNQDQDNEHNGSQGLYGDEREMRRQRGEKESDKVGWWLLQFVLVVPAPVIMAAHIANMLLDASSQTLADGNNKAGVYATASLVGFLLILPLAPFSFKLNKGVGWLLLLLFFIFTLWSIFWAFPFDAEIPLKVFFQQTVQLEGAVTSISPSRNVSWVYDVNKVHDATAGTVKNIVTSLYGAPEYLKDDVIPKLPSSHNKPIDCYKSHAKSGLIGCSWDSGYDMIPQPGSAPKPQPNHNDIPNTTSTLSLPFKTLDQTDFFHAEVTRISPTSAEIAIRGKNTRNCRIYFDNRPIVKYTVSGSVIGMQPRYGVHEEGIDQVRLWSRDWDKVFVVDVEWRDYMGLGEGLRGRVACEWAEYASASAGVPGQGGNPTKGGFRSAKIPALEEVLSFLPTWVVVSKFADGLVEAWESFEV